MRFEMDELLDVVALSKAGNCTGSMLVNTQAQIAGNADIQRSVWATGEDVNEGLVHDGNVSCLVIEMRALIAMGSRLRGDA